MSTAAYEGTLHVLGCADCGMDFGITKRFEEKRRKDHRTFYCPAGHSNYYPQKSDLEKEREKAKRARAEARAAQEEAEAARREAAECEERLCSLPTDLHLATLASADLQPRYRTAFWLGFTARQQDKPALENPYKSAPFVRAWDEGYWRQEDEEE